MNDVTTLEAGELLPVKAPLNAINAGLDDLIVAVGD